jgi:CheY-like chemotaxis protein
MKKILLAEDDRNTATVLTLRLQGAGYHVINVSDGLRSYLRSVTEKPDLILMDIVMPMGNGLQVAREIQEAGLSSIPIIFLTASKSPDLRDAAETLGAAGFIEKPYDPQALLRAISKALNRSKPNPSAEQDVPGKGSTSGMAPPLRRKTTKT